MTEREEAKAQAEEAMERAEHLRVRGDRIAKAWRESKMDNNFRQMLRQLTTRRVIGNGPS